MRKEMQSDIQKEKKAIESIKRHIFICIGEQCCDSQIGLEIWDYLKSQLAEKKLTNVYRTKVGCLRICADGPIALVYPEGTWYRLVDRDAVDQIISQHLILGRPVNRLAFAHSKLINPEEHLLGSEV